MKIQEKRNHWKRYGTTVLCLLVMLISFVGCTAKKTDTLADGTYLVDVRMEGGSGRATVASPTEITVKNGEMTATIIWSSSHYDYMLVGGEKYLNEAADGEGSTFTIPVDDLDQPLSVVGDTTAMSQPHEIEYTLNFSLIDIEE